MYATDPSNRDWSRTGADSLQLPAVFQLVLQGTD